MLGLRRRGAAAPRCSPTRSATPTAPTRPPSTCSTRPAGWSRSTPGTSTGSTPRATSSPARRWPRSPSEVAAAAGLDQRAARRLLAATRRVADRCAVDPRADLGIGEVHFPELDVLGATAPADVDPAGGGRAQAVLRERCEAGLGRRAMPRHRRGAAPARRRARDHRDARLPVLLPHRRRRRRPDPRHGGAGRRARLRGGQPGQLPARHLRGRPDAPRPADGAVPLAAARARCPTSTSTSSRPGAPRSTSRSSTGSAASGSPACR